ncbi:MAG: hypothetical protein U0800_22275 [Isosphaeraceae bacterium]
MVNEPARSAGRFRPIAVAALVLSWAILLIGGMRMRQLQHERDEMADREARAVAEAQMQRARAEEREQQAIEAVKRFHEAVAEAQVQQARAEEREEEAIEAVKRITDAVRENPELRDNPELAPLREKLLRPPGGRPGEPRGEAGPH